MVVAAVATAVVTTLLLAGGRTSSGRHPERGSSTPSPAGALAGVQRALQANTPGRLYGIMARASRGGRTQEQFTADVRRQMQRTGPVTKARFIGRPRIRRTSAGPLMTARLRLRYVRNPGGDYAAVFVSEYGAWKLWSTERWRRAR